MMVKKKTRQVVLSDFSGKAKTDFIKYQLMRYWRFDRQFTFVCSECINNADISAIDDKNLAEVEIKISKQDFLREFSGESRIKAYKHKVLQGEYKPTARYIEPNYFYFCVTPELSSFVKSYLEENGYKNYGLLVCCEKTVYGKKSHIECVKSAKKIHAKTPSGSAVKKVSKRVQSELINLIEKKYKK